ncbi:hypothetical protein ES708_30860 [subsurface metagenome]
MKRTVFVNILLGILVLTVVIGGIVLAFQFISGSGRGKTGDRFKYDIEDLKKIDPDLITYSEVIQIKLEMEEPHGVAAGRDDRIYVCGDSAILIISKEGKPVHQIDLGEPARCISVGEDGLLYLGMVDHVEVYEETGKQHALWAGLGHEALITSIATGGKDVYVADAGNRMVMRFGRLLGYIGKENHSPGAQGFVVPSPYFDVAVGRDKTLWVVNPGRHLLQNYTPEGKFIRSWGHSSVSIEGFCGCCNPTHIAITGEGSFVTSEKGLARVKVYDPMGGFIGVVAGPRHFAERTVGLDLAVDSRGRVIVLDPKKNALRIFSKNTL